MAEEASGSAHGSATGSTSGGSDGGGELPAWKKRMMMKPKARPLTGSSSHSHHTVKSKIAQAKAQAEADPNLPPAFKAAFKRAAFHKQQKRRKLADEFNSLNSSHPTPSVLGDEEGGDDAASDLSFDDDSFGGDSFGDDEEEEIVEIVMEVEDEDSDTWN